MTTRVKEQHIVILGGGYGGLMTAIRLAGKTRRKPIKITLVNGLDTFVNRIRLHESAVGKKLARTPITQYLHGTGVNFVQGWVTAIMPENHAVSLKTATGTQTINYDKLVVALGSLVDQDTVSGVKDHAYVLNAFGDNDAYALNNRLNEIDPKTAKIVVVGGGATGIEAAGEVRSKFPDADIKLVTQGKFGTFKHDLRIENIMRKAMARQHINILEESPVKAVNDDELVLANGDTLPFDVCIWAGGFKANPLAQQAGLTVNDKGQILTDPYLRSLSHPDIFAIGDAGFSQERPGAPVRMSVFVALVNGAHIADSLARQIRGKDMRPFSFSWYGQGIALGKRAAVGFTSFPDDKPLFPLVFRGSVGHYFRAFFVWFVVFSLKIERYLPGFFYWFGKNRYMNAQKQTNIAKQNASFSRN